MSQRDLNFHDESVLFGALEIASWASLERCMRTTRVASWRTLRDDMCNVFTRVVLRQCAVWLNAEANDASKHSFVMRN